MKFNELIEKHYNDHGYDYKHSIQGDELRLLCPSIMKCDEFKDCNVIVVKDLPEEVIDGETLKASTARYLPCKTEKVLYLHLICISPKVFDPTTLHTPVKDDIVITPMLFDPSDFTARKSLTIMWKPDMPDWERKNNGEEKLIQLMLVKIEKALRSTNPEEYFPKSQQLIIIRAYKGFGELIDPDSKEKYTVSLNK